MGSVMLDKISQSYMINEVLAGRDTLTSCEPSSLVQRHLQCLQELDIFKADICSIMLLLHHFLIPKQDELAITS